MIARVSGAVFVIVWASAAPAQVSGTAASPAGFGLPGAVLPLGLPSPMAAGQRSMTASAGIPLGAMELHTPGETPLMPGLPLNMNAHLLSNNASQGTSVGPAGIPLGASALGNLGVSPPAPVGVASLTLLPGGSEACPVTSAGSSPLFDGNASLGMTGSGGATGTCPGASMGASQLSLASQRSGAVRYRPLGRSAGIAMGASELQNPGLSRAPAGSLSLTTPLAAPSQLSPFP